MPLFSEPRLECHLSAYKWRMMLQHPVDWFYDHSNQSQKQFALGRLVVMIWS